MQTASKPVESGLDQQLLYTAPAQPYYPVPQQSDYMLQQQPGYVQPLATNVYEAPQQPGYMQQQPGYMQQSAANVYQVPQQQQPGYIQQSAMNVYQVPQQSDYMQQQQPGYMQQYQVPQQASYSLSHMEPPCDSQPTQFQVRLLSESPCVLSQATPTDQSYQQPANAKLANLLARKMQSTTSSVLRHPSRRAKRCSMCRSPLSLRQEGKSSGPPPLCHTTGPTTASYCADMAMPPTAGDYTATNQLAPAQMTPPPVTVLVHMPNVQHPTPMNGSQVMTRTALDDHAKWQAPGAIEAPASFSEGPVLHGVVQHSHEPNPGSASSSVFLVDTQLRAEETQTGSVSSRNLLAHESGVASQNSESNPAASPTDSASSQNVLTSESGPPTSPTGSVSSHNLLVHESDQVGTYSYQTMEPLCDSQPTQFQVRLLSEYPCVLPQATPTDQSYQQPANAKLANLLARKMQSTTSSVLRHASRHAKQRSTCHSPLSLRQEGKSNDPPPLCHTTGPTTASYCADMAMPPTAGDYTATNQLAPAQMTPPPVIQHPTPMNGSQVMTRTALDDHAKWQAPGAIVDPASFSEGPVLHGVVQHSHEPNSGSAISSVCLVDTQLRAEETQTGSVSSRNLLAHESGVASQNSESSPTASPTDSASSQNVLAPESSPPTSPSVSSQNLLAHQVGALRSPTGSVSSQTNLVPSNYQPAPIDAHVQVHREPSTQLGLSERLAIVETDTPVIPHPCGVQKTQGSTRQTPARKDRPAVTGLGMVNANTFLVDFGPGISDVVFPVLRNEALRYKSHVSLTSTQLSRGNSATNYFVPVVSETIRDSPTKITPAQLADIATTPSETPSAPETPSGTSSLPAVEANLESKDWSSQFTPTEAIDAPPTTIRDSPTTPSETHRAPKTPGDTSSLPAVEDAQAAKLQAEDWSPEELRRMHEVETVTAGARDQNLKRFFESQDSVDVFDNPPEPQIMPRIPLKQPQEKQIEVSNFPSLSRNAGNVDFDTQRRLHIERDRQQNVAFHQEYSAALWKSQAQVMRREKAEEDRLSRMLQRQQQERSQFDLSGFDFPSLGEAASQPRRVTTCISKPVTQFPSLKARPVGDCVSDDEFEGWLTPVCATEPPLKEWMQERWEGGNTSDALTLLFNLDFPIPWVEARELSLPLLKILAATCLDAVREAKEKQNATKSFTFQRRLDDAGVQKADLVEIAKWLVKTRISLERAPNFNEYECARALDDLYQKLYAKKGKRGNKKRKNLSLYPNT